MVWTQNACRVVILIGVAMVYSPAIAATRVCGEIIAIAGEDPKSETTAKKRALDGWITAATKLGPAFALWRNASEKSLSCLKLPQGSWRCQAYARPCGVAQVPGQQPPGSLQPPAPSLPKAKGIDAGARHPIVGAAQS